MVAFLMQASVCMRPLTQALHSGGTVAVGFPQSGGAVVPIPPHTVKHGDAGAQMQPATTRLMNFFCASGFDVAQHFPQVLSEVDGVGHVVQSDASAQGSPPAPVEVVPVAVVFDPVVAVVFEPLVAFEPVVAPPLPAPPLPPVSPELLVVSLLPQAVAAIIDRTIAPNAQDFMLMPPAAS